VLELFELEGERCNIEIYRVLRKTYHTLQCAVPFIHRIVPWHACPMTHSILESCLGTSNRIQQSETGDQSRKFSVPRYSGTEGLIRDQ
jgi:hypothetical protein